MRRPDVGGPPDGIPEGEVLVVLASLLGFALAVALLGPVKPKYATLTLTLACDASFAWGSVRFFRRPGGGLLPSQRRALGVTYGTALLHVLVVIYGYRGDLLRFQGGVALYLASLALFWSSVVAASGRRLRFFFAAEPSDGLVERGPYRAVRHPFYASYTLAWAAGALATGRPLLGLSVALNFAVYYHAATLEEGQFDGSPLARRYRTYRGRTGMFLPRLGWAASTKAASRRARTGEQLAVASGLHGGE